MCKKPPRRAAYLIRTCLFWIKAEGRFISDGGVLVEMTAKELRDIEKLQGPRLPRYRRVDGHYAHKWVRDGYQHETALYIDHDNRVRYAFDGDGV